MKPFALVLAAAVAIGPAYAGTVYVPVAKTNPNAQGVSYQTRVVLSNTGQVQRRATPSVIALNADGTERDDVEVLSPVLVNGGATVVVQNLLGGLETALVELNMAPQLLASAQVVSVDGAGAVSLGATWPIISDSNLTPADQVAHLQGWMRSTTAKTDFGLVNLGGAAVCDVDVYRIDGVHLGHYELQRPALSFALFQDVLNAIGVSSGSQLRAEVSCDQPFYAFASTTDDVTHEHSVVTASALGTSTLQVPGEAPPCPDGGVCFDQQGVYFTSLSNARTTAYNVAVPPNQTYSNLTLDFDFFFTGWWGANSSGEHNFFWINRGAFNPPTGYPAWTNNVFGYANARGPGRDRVTLVTNIDLGSNNTSFITTNAGLQPGRQYHVRYEYNHASRVVNLEVTDGGVLVAQIVGVTTGPLTTKSNSAFMLYFGNDVGHNGQEVPWLPGTQWSNLVYRMNR